MFLNFRGGLRVFGQRGALEKLLELSLITTAQRLGRSGDCLDVIVLKLMHFSDNSVIGQRLTGGKDDTSKGGEVVEGFHGSLVWEKGVR